MIDRELAPWWKGKRGEWYVAGQVVLLLLVFFGPRHLTALPPWPAWLTPAFRIAGAIVMLAGATLLVGGILQQGKRVTPLPYPVDGGVLLESGVYAVVRHPMYAGGVVLAYGWALLVHGWLTLLYATALLVFADFKASLEERWLTELYPVYPAYQRRVRKLIPFVY